MKRRAAHALKSITITGPRAQRRPSKGSLTIDARTALLVRSVCRHDGFDLTAFVDAMLRTYLSAQHPTWVTVSEATVERLVVIRTPHKRFGKART